jgi:hypothetical protein
MAVFFLAAMTQDRSANIRCRPTPKAELACFSRFVLDRTARDTRLPINGRVPLKAGAAISVTAELVEGSGSLPARCGLALLPSGGSPVYGPKEGTRASRKMTVAAAPGCRPSITARPYIAGASDFVRICARVEVAGCIPP